MRLARHLQYRYRRLRQALIQRSYRRHIYRLHPQDRPIVDALERDGVCVTSVQALARSGIDISNDLFDESRLLLAKTPRRAVAQKNFTAYATKENVSANPMLLLWGLNERLLTIVENYIGMPVAYRGIVVRRDFADGQQADTRMWHLDGEDSRSLKIIVYLNDVGNSGGPFSYIPKFDTPPFDAIEFSHGRVTDSTMNKLVASDRQIRCTGLSGTVVFADTCSVFHKGAIPTDSDRLSVFYAYTSRNPLHPEYCKPLFTSDQLPGEIKLSARQRAAIHYR